MESVFRSRILQGRVAFVTGGGTGISGGVARALAEAGASVALVSRSLEHLEPAAKSINDARSIGSPTVREGNSEDRATRDVRAGMPALQPTVREGNSEDRATRDVRAGMPALQPTVREGNSEDRATR